MSFVESELIISNAFLNVAHPVDTGHWQAIKNVPQTKTLELRSVLLEYDIPRSIEQLQVEVTPNLPWAEDHFQERVAGLPLNPGDQYKNWPWYKGNVEKHQTVEEEKFSHTYMERYWPKEIVQGGQGKRGYGQPDGIRYDYGDLDDVVDLLAREPYTRQAYLPVWFPEDTGAHHGERVPCSLGYHFMLREGKLHCFYPIRSCDFLRHFRDDVYLTCRLVQWVIDEVSKLGGTWEYDEKGKPELVEQPPINWLDVTPGELSMFMHSLHIFEGDLPAMRKKYGS